MDRKDFIKKACIAGVCFCGFSRLPGLANNEPAASQEAPNHLTQDWLSGLLSTLDQELEEEQLRAIIKNLSKVHYDDLNMDRVLADYKGDLDKFIRFLEQSWGWRVDYNKVTKVLTADENKNYCVCPILAHKKEVNTAAVCYCSEGFAEEMFSTVTGTPVKASIVSSVRKGDKTCVYRIDLHA
jgi:hypothetical protein